MSQRRQRRVPAIVCVMSSWLWLGCGGTEASAEASAVDTSSSSTEDTSDAPGPDAAVDDVADVGAEDAIDTAEGPAADVEADTASPVDASFRAVHVDASVGVPAQLAVHACAGLYNRRTAGSVFVKTDADVSQPSIDGALANDELWLDTLELTPSSTIEASAFLAECVADFGGCVRYSYATQHELLPAILTIGSALGVPPLADESPLTCTSPTVDAVKELAGRDTQLLATEYAYQHHLTQTLGLAMLNPGYDRQPADLAAPSLKDDMPVALIDLVFSRKLFVVFLVNGCVDLHPEEALLSKIVSESGWETPVPVYGYNDSWLAGGYLYEAQTRCLESANMGAIPTRTTNLSFFDTRPTTASDTAALPTIPPEVVTYDPKKTYVAFVIGDGDNVRYVMSTRKDWLEQRLATCRGVAQPCPPLTWTLSPHLSDLAPDVLRWYLEAIASTGSDYLMLPPSGYLYAYPGMMPPAEQARFVTATEAAGKVLSAHSVIHWEWFEGWEKATSEFIPRYAHQGGQIQGVFPMNVPYLLEAFPSWPEEKEYEIIQGADGGRVVLFRSHSWRGVNDSDAFHPSPQHMADRLAALPAGTVTWVYMTSDGGLSLENSYAALTTLLPDHVQLVSTDAAARLALEAAAK